MWTRDARSNLVLSMTDSLNRQTAYTYDTAGNRLTITRLAGTPAALTTAMTYEPVFNQIGRITDPLGHSTTLQYDAAGNVIRMSDGLQHGSDFTYASEVNPTLVADPLGHVTTYAYVRGDLTSITDSPRSRRSSRRGRADCIENRPSGARYEYPLTRGPCGATDGSLGVGLFSHDANGNLATLTDARSNTTSYTHTSMDDRAS